LCSDTATPIFDNVRVPASNSNIIREKNKGFLSNEKNQHKANHVGSSEHNILFRTVVERVKTFGARLIGHQVMKHKLVDIRMDMAQHSAAGLPPPAPVCDQFKLDIWKRR
jgi:acyl-CoA dehydrogenase